MKEARRSGSLALYTRHFLSSSLSSIFVNLLFFLVVIIFTFFGMNHHSVHAQTTVTTFSSVNPDGPNAFTSWEMRDSSLNDFKCNTLLYDSVRERFLCGTNEIPARIITINGYPYFGANATLTLDSGDDEIISGVSLSSSYDYVWFGLNTNPTRYRRYNLVTQQADGTNTMNSDFRKVAKMLYKQGANPSDDRIYSLYDLAPGRLIQHEVSDLNPVEPLTFASTFNNPKVMEFFTDNEYIVVVSGDSPAKVALLLIEAGAAPTVKHTLTLNSGESSVDSLACIGIFCYILCTPTASNGMKLVKVKVLTSYEEITRVNHLDYNPGAELYFPVAGVDSWGMHIYFGGGVDSSGVDGVVYRIQVEPKMKVLVDNTVTFTSPGRRPVHQGLRIPNSDRWFFVGTTTASSNSALYSMRDYYIAPYSYSNDIIVPNVHNIANVMYYPEEEAYFLVSQGNYKIIKWVLLTGVMSEVLGDGTSTPMFNGNSDTNAQIGTVFGMAPAYDKNNNFEGFWISTPGVCAVALWETTNAGKFGNSVCGVKSNIGQTYGVCKNTGTSARMTTPQGLASYKGAGYDDSFTLVADQSTHVVGAIQARSVGTDYEFKAVAGTGTTGDQNGNGNIATFTKPKYVVIYPSSLQQDPHSPVAFVSMAEAAQIRKITGIQPGVLAASSVATVFEPTGQTESFGGLWLHRNAEPVDDPRIQLLYYTTESSNRLVRFTFFNSTIGDMSNPEGVSETDFGGRFCLKTNITVPFVLQNGTICGARDTFSEAQARQNIMCVKEHVCNLETRTMTRTRTKTKTKTISQLPFDRLVHASELGLASGLSSPYGLATDGGQYLFTGSGTGKTVRVTFQQATGVMESGTVLSGTLTGCTSLTTAVYDCEFNNTLYYVCTSSTTVHRVDPTTMTEIGSFIKLSTAVGMSEPHIAVADNISVIIANFATSDTEAFTRVFFSNFSINSAAPALTAPAVSNRWTAGAVSPDKTAAYFTSVLGNDMIVRICDLSNETTVFRICQSRTFAANEEDPYGVLVVGSFVYVGVAYNSVDSRLVKLTLYLSRISHSPSVVENRLGGFVADAAGEFLYAATTNGFPSNIIRFRLADMSITQKIGQSVSNNFRASAYITGDNFFWLQSSLVPKIQYYRYETWTSTTTTATSTSTPQPTTTTPTSETPKSSSSTTSTTTSTTSSTTTSTTTTATSTSTSTSTPTSTSTSTTQEPTTSTSITYGPFQPLIFIDSSPLPSPNIAGMARNYFTNNNNHLYMINSNNATLLRYIINVSADDSNNNYNQIIKSPSSPDATLSLPNCTNAGGLTFHRIISQYRPAFPESVLVTCTDSNTIIRVETSAFSVNQIFSTAKVMSRPKVIIADNISVIVAAASSISRDTHFTRLFILNMSAKQVTGSLAVSGDPNWHAAAINDDRSAAFFIRSQPATLKKICALSDENTPARLCDEAIFFVGEGNARSVLYHNTYVYVGLDKFTTRAMIIKFRASDLSRVTSSSPRINFMGVTSLLVDIVGHYLLATVASTQPTIFRYQIADLENVESLTDNVSSDIISALNIPTSDDVAGSQIDNFFYLQSNAVESNLRHFRYRPFTTTSTSAAPTTTTSSTTSTSTSTTTFSPIPIVTTTTTTTTTSTTPTPTAQTPTTTTTTSTSTTPTTTTTQKNTKTHSLSKTITPKFKTTSKSFTIIPPTAVPPTFAPQLPAAEQAAVSSTATISAVVSAPAASQTLRSMSVLGVIDTGPRCEIDQEKQERENQHLISPSEQKEKEKDEDLVRTRDREFPESAVPMLKISYGDPRIEKKYGLASRRGALIANTFIAPLFIFCVTCLGGLLRKKYFKMFEDKSIFCAGRVPALTCAVLGALFLDGIFASAATLMTIPEGEVNGADVALSIICCIISVVVAVTPAFFLWRRLLHNQEALAAQQQKQQKQQKQQQSIDEQQQAYNEDSSSKINNNNNKIQKVECLPSVFRYTKQKTIDSHKGRRFERSSGVMWFVFGDSLWSGDLEIIEKYRSIFANSRGLNSKDEKKFGWGKKKRRHLSVASFYIDVLLTIICSIGRGLATANPCRADGGVQFLLFIVSVIAFLFSAFIQAPISPMRRWAEIASSFIMMMGTFTLVVLGAEAGEFVGRCAIAGAFVATGSTMLLFIMRRVILPYRGMEIVSRKKMAEELAQEKLDSINGIVPRSNVATTNDINLVADLLVGPLVGDDGAVEENTTRHDNSNDNDDDQEADDFFENLLNENEYHDENNDGEEEEDNGGILLEEELLEFSNEDQQQEDVFAQLDTAVDDYDHNSRKSYNGSDENDVWSSINN